MDASPDDAWGVVLRAGGAGCALCGAHDSLRA